MAGFSAVASPWAVGWAFRSGRGPARPLLPAPAASLARPPAPCALMRQARQPAVALRRGGGRRRAPCHPAAASPVTPPPEGEGRITEEELEEVAARRGVRLRLTTLGPAWRVTARISTASEAGEEEEDESIVGVAEGFCLLGIHHIDSMRVFNSRLPQEQRGKQGPWGLMILLGVASGLHALGKGCNKAEILAINDSEKQHRRLVKLYERIGWETVRVVEGGRLQDIPDQLVWGGAGTRMNGDVGGLVDKWSGVLRGSGRG